MNDVWLAWFHFIALIGVASLLVSEHLLLKPGLSGAALHRLKAVDGVYAVFAVAALATGLMRLFWGSKGSSYYWSNPLFHAKFGLFVLIAVLSIAPTLRYIAWSGQARRDAAFSPPPAEVKRAQMALRLQLLLLLFLPLLAAGMARGLTRFGQLF